MALKNILILGSLLATLVVSDLAFGQVDIPSPRFRYRELESPDSTRPFATPGVFDYDAQFFAPLEFTNNEDPDPRCGFYANYDRTYTSVGKAGRIDTTSTQVPDGYTYIWGTRCELGWMSEEDSGWELEYQNASGIYFAAGQDISVPNPLLVDSSFASVDINKVFRQTTKRGEYFEPYIGARFFNVSDNTIEDTLQTINTVIVGNRFKQNTTNNSFGFQAGATYNSRRGRWRCTTDGSIATTYNQQRYFATDITNVPFTVQSITEFYQTDQSFVPILDLQYEVAYYISRDISLKTGVQLMWAWNGIARANTLTTNLNPNSFYNVTGTNGGAGLFDQDFLAAGFIFGFEWRR